jgi:endonuclease III
MASRERLIEDIVRKLGGCFSTELGIDLSSAGSSALSAWFIASLLFGARISEKVAKNTYLLFARRNIITPKAILATGWDGLVELLDAGGYVRYDFKTATKLLAVMEVLIEEYGGDLNELHRRAEDARDLEQRIISLGKGIGRTTAYIFLRELRDIWEKADPLPNELVIIPARRLGLVENKGQEEVLLRLKGFFQERKKLPFRFSDFEAALIRLGKGYCRKEKCASCPVRMECFYDREV